MLCHSFTTIIPIASVLESGKTYESFFVLDDRRPAGTSVHKMLGADPLPAVAPGTGSCCCGLCIPPFSDAYLFFQKDGFQFVGG